MGWPSTLPRLEVALLGATLATLAGCADPGPPWTGNDESILGYVLTFLFVAAIGVAAAVAVLIGALFLLAASGSLIAWNVLRPHPLGRVLGVALAVVDSLAGTALLAGLLWLSIDTRGGVTRIDLDGGGFVGLLAAALLLVGPATFLSALAPTRPPATPSPPSTGPPGPP